MDVQLQSGRATQQPYLNHKRSSSKKSKSLESHNKNAERSLSERRLVDEKTRNLFSYGTNLCLERYMNELVEKFEELEAAKQNRESVHEVLGAENPKMYERLQEMICQNNMKELNEEILPFLLRSINNVLVESKMESWQINAVIDKFSERLRPVNAQYQVFLKTFQGSFTSVEKFFEALLTVSTYDIAINEFEIQNPDLLFYKICLCKAYLTEASKLAKPNPEETSLSIVYFETRENQKDFFVNLEPGQEICLNYFMNAMLLEPQRNPPGLLRIKMPRVEAYRKLYAGIILPRGSAFKVFKVDKTQRNFEIIIDLELIDSNKTVPLLIVEERKFSPEKNKMFFIGQDYFEEIWQNEDLTQNPLEDRAQNEHFPHQRSVHPNISEESVI